MHDRSGLVIGFDLDMTLVDSRPGIAATLAALAAETGTLIDAELAVNRLGPPLEDELAHWFPAEEVAAVSDRFRALYADHGVPGTCLLEGAAEAVAAVRAAGGRVVVVTAKFEPNAVACLEQVGLVVDAVCGWCHGPGKGVALAEHGAAVYIGDTPTDVASALGVGIVAVGVATGPHPRDELVAAGAEGVLGSLVEFPEWLRGWLAR
ncbi:MAG TPA: haloacid dehalogenase-like hydrolase [Acidimicrobiia bacterium]|nr:haloacid dehalogenase-like hydrolase [Acidimicrobiia bacterium]